MDIRDVKVKGLTPIEFSDEIGYYKLGVIVHDPIEDKLIGGRVYNKKKQQLEYIEVGCELKIEVRPNKAGNTIHVLENIGVAENQISNKVVNSIEDPF
jgi:hypothetical protein